MSHQYFPIRLLTSHLCWRRTPVLERYYRRDKQTANYILLRLQVVPLTFVAEKNYCITDLETLAVVWSIAQVHSSLQNVPVWSKGDHLH